MNLFGVFARCKICAHVVSHRPARLFEYVVSILSKHSLLLHRARFLLDQSLRLPLLHHCSSDWLCVRHTVAVQNRTGTETPGDKDVHKCGEPNVMPRTSFDRMRYRFFPFTAHAAFNCPQHCPPCSHNSWILRPRGLFRHQDSRRTREPFQYVHVLVDPVAQLQTIEKKLCVRVVCILASTLS